MHKFKAIPCPDGSWQITPETKFTEDQAHLIADLLNRLENAQYGVTVTGKRREIEVLARFVRE